jgi:hypothetical protein
MLKLPKILNKDLEWSEYDVVVEAYMQSITYRMNYIYDVGEHYV